MAKGKKSKKSKRTGIELEKPTFFSSVKKHPAKVVKSGGKGAAAGAGGGAAVSLTMGTDLGVSVGVGAGVGLVCGVVDGAIDAHDLESTIHRQGEALIESLDDAFEEVEDIVEQAGSIDVRELVSEVRTSLMGEDRDDEDDEGDEDEKPAKKKPAKRKGARARAR